MKKNVMEKSISLTEVLKKIFVINKKFRKKEIIFF